MTSNVAEFSTAVRNWIHKTVPDKVKTTQRAICLYALGRLVETTPADIGRARGNWQVTFAIPTFTVRDLDDPDGSVSRASGADILAALGDFEVVFLQNNVEYIEVLENGGFIPPDPGPSKDKRPDRLGKTLVAKGYSTQAPNGMLKVVFEEIKAGFK